MQVQTIDDVIQALDNILDWAWHEKSRLGYFAALYRRVTRSVRDGIAQNQFENGPLMEKLDVVFAGRYLQAFEQFRSGQEPTLSWQVAFRAGRSRSPIVVQQLLAGINAHINLDLGIAAATVAPGEQLASLKTDFDQINAVLAGEVGIVEKEIAKISPLIGLLEKFGLKTETSIINFSLDEARNFAWLHAQKLAGAAPGQLNTMIAALDAEAAAIGKLVASPLFLVRLALLPIRIFETSNVHHVLDVLTGGQSAAPSATKRDAKPDAKKAGA